MPKIVNHETQRRLVVEAALRVIRQSGLEQATVRKIAEEAGLSVGSMRHYFSSQVELFAFCMNIFVERVEKRLEAFELTGPLLTDLKDCCCSFCLLMRRDRWKWRYGLLFMRKPWFIPN